MASKLSYFHQLEAVTRLFNAPGDDVCLRPEFVPMLARLDECLDYVQQNVRDMREEREKRETYTSFRTHPSVAIDHVLLR